MESIFDRLHDNIESTLYYVPESVSPFSTIVMLIGYLYIVLKQGPKFMQNRKAYDLKSVILVYNFLQIVANISLVLTGGFLIWYSQDTYVCLTRNPLYLKMTVLFYTLKCCDLIETFIFVLRKKANQVSMLHVYHHLMVIIGTYIELVFSPSGHNMLPGLMNALVHAIMYSYYFISAYDPELMKLEMFKRWKKMVTQIQLLQFFIAMAHYIWPLVLGHCNMPPVFSLFCISQDIMMIYLFGRFYMKTYVNNDKTK
ncbi:Elongation of very long chain fatty acids protein [Pseudolycoriella hygida]|uniref:Elongation of very long chain fatty acids protein n=1 Tax=Pseudolycoriella hygida TaxID=35572 RepID=A0A9Q0RZM0_9DIPT|nr:Elongation of very long chain fatty acids protein [Pseudolycoriella hygida]